MVVGNVAFSPRVSSSIADPPISLIFPANLRQCCGDIPPISFGAFSRHSISQRVSNGQLGDGETLLRSTDMRVCEIYEILRHREREIALTPITRGRGQSKEYKVGRGAREKCFLSAANLMIPEL